MKRLLAAVLVFVSMGSQPTIAREFDAETGLIHLGARDYDPQTGRFLQEDPEWDSNLYVYGLNNPNTFTDSTGRSPVKHFIAGIRPIFELITNVANAPNNGDPTYPPAVSDEELLMLAAIGIPELAFSRVVQPAAAGVCGTELTGFTRHGLNQVINRGLRPREILNILRNPSKKIPGRGDVTRVIGEIGELRINNQGKLVTAIRHKPPSAP